MTNLKANSRKYIEIWKLDEIINGLDILQTQLNKEMASPQTGSLTYEIPSYFSSDTNVFYSLCELFKFINEQALFGVNRHSDPKIAWENYRNDLDTLIEKYVKICLERNFTISAIHLISFSGSPMDIIERIFVADKSLNNFINSVLKPLLKQNVANGRKTSNTSKGSNKTLQDQERRHA